MNSVVRDHLFGRLPRHAPHLPRGADQRRRLRAAASSRGRRAPSSTPATRARSRAAPPRSSQRIAEAVFAGAGAGDPRQGHGGAGRHLRQLRPRRPRPRQAARGYVMYQISGGGYGGNADPRRPHQRLLDHRHLQDAAGRGHGAVLSRALPPLRPARRLRRRRHAPRRLRRALRGRAPARRGARLLRHGPRPLRPAGRARRRGRRAERRARPSAAARPSSRSTFPRTRTSRSAPATASRS